MRILLQIVADAASAAAAGVAPSTRCSISSSPLRIAGTGEEPRQVAEHLAEDDGVEVAQRDGPARVSHRELTDPHAPWRRPGAMPRRTACEPSSFDPEK